MDNSWCKLFHKSGLQVTVALPADVKLLLPTIDYLLGVGFLVDAPGIEPGEEREEVAFVVHGEHEKDGETTPFILLYSSNDAMKWSFLKIYLNDDKAVSAFEHASKMKLASIPVYIGNDKPERGKSSKIDKFIVPAPRPFQVVLKQNPRWSQEAADAAAAKKEMYTVPKRIFVRWCDSAPAADSKPQPSVYEKAKSAISAVESLSSNASIDWGIRLEDLRDKGELTVEQFNELAGLLMSKTEGTI